VIRLALLRYSERIMKRQAVCLKGARMTTEPNDQGELPEHLAAHATTTGMTGGGFYNANSAPQWRSIEAVLPWLEDAVASLPRGTGPLTLADFGCSEGHNSIRVMSRAVSTLLKTTQRPIQTIHSDLPTNDFSNLFRELGSAGRAAFGSKRVFSSAVGGSMFDQLLPPGSLHVAMSFNAIGFLSKMPLASLPGYILPNGPSTVRNNGYVSEEEREIFARLARQDVAAFLRARAEELVPGGKVLVQVFGSTDDARTCDGIYDVLNDAVLDHVEDGEISRAVYDAYYQPVYFRTLEELTAPLSDPSSCLADLFRLERSEAYEVSVPFNDRLAADGDLAIYARDYTNFFRAFTEAVLARALPEEDRRAGLVDRIYRRAQELVATHPHAYPFRYAALAMLLTRK
jgi:hypothetical protein